MTSVQVSKVVGSSAPAQQRTRSRRFTAEREQGTYSAEVVVAGALAVELAGAEVDVRGAVAVHPRLGLEAVGAGVAGVEGDGLEDGEHSARAACTGVESALAGGNSLAALHRPRPTPRTRVAAAQRLVWSL